MATAAYAINSTVAEATTGPSRPRFYAPELDALRFGAFLMVYCRHVVNFFGAIQSGSQTQGTGTVSNASVSGHGFHLMPMVQSILQSLDFGVCLFFFLSTFLITRLLLIEQESTGSVAVRNFYMRRALRIWPLYYTFIAGVLALSVFIPSIAVSGSRLLAAVFFVANWAAVLHGWSALAIQPLWSVSVEEQFYLVWPLFARYGRAAIVAASAILALASIVMLLVLGHRTGLEVTAVWPNTLVQSIFLAGGALTACFSTPETRTLSGRIRAGLFLAGIACWIVASTACHVVNYRSPQGYSLLVGYLLVLLGTFFIFTGTAGWNKRAVPAWLIQLGKISYGLYVFHALVLLLLHEALFTYAAAHGWAVSPYLLEAVNAIVSFAIVLACAQISYRHLEMPFLRLKDRFAIIRSRPV